MIVQLLLFLLFFNVDSASFAQKEPTQKELEANELVQTGLQKKDNQLLAEGYFRKGKIADGEGDLTNASKWFQKARLLYLKNGASKELARVLNRLSSIEYKQNHYQESVRIINESIQIAQEINDERTLYMGYASRGLGIASLGLSKGDTSQLFKKVFADFLRAEGIAKKINDTEGLREMYLMYGSIFQSLNRPHESLALFLKIKPDYDKKEFNQPKVIFSLQLARIYSHLNQITEAQKIIKDLSPYIENPAYSDFSVQLFYHEVAGTLFEKLGNLKKAIYHYKAWMNLKERINQQDNEGQLTLLNKKFDSKAKNKEIQQKKEALVLIKKQQETQKTLLFVSILFAISTFFFLIYILNLYIKYKRLSQKNALLVHEQNHRVKNNLQVVSSMLNIQSNMMKKPSMVKVISEIKLRINSMIELQKQLYSQDLEKEDVDLKAIIYQLIDAAAYNFDVTPIDTDFSLETREISRDCLHILILIMNELITNACKYAFHDINNPQLGIQIWYNKNNDMQIIVRDNGKHPIINTKILTSNKSFGFRMINMLLQQLDGQIHYEYKQGACFQLSLKNKWKR